MSKMIRPLLVSFVAMTLLTGVVYPLLVTGIGKVLFPEQASGSLLMKDGKAVGSSLIGQNFTNPRYFWGRPSATGPYPYNALNSSGSNLGPTNPALLDIVKSRIVILKAADPTNTQPVPVDLVTTSGSGLDPHISVAAADYQVSRIARLRAMSLERVKQLVVQNTEDRQLGVLGEPRVNVLKLNLALDALR